MPRPKKDPKIDALRKQGCLHPHPDKVTDEAFAASDFFDPRDLVQVKYEMLRQVSREGASKAQAAALFGLSRPTYYQAEAAFAQGGLSGLLPRPRGPKAGHKLTVQVMAFIEQRVAGEGRVRARTLAREIRAKLGLSVHPRSIERAIARKKKR